MNINDKFVGKYTELVPSLPSLGNEKKTPVKKMDLPF